MNAQPNAERGDEYGLLSGLPEAKKVDICQPVFFSARRVSMRLKKSFPVDINQVVCYLNGS
jgi:hypothetical protein